MVKVFGSSPPCAKCKEVEKRALKVAEKHPGKIEVEKLSALSEAGRKYGVFFTPTVIINDKTVSTGEVISEKELEKLVLQELEGE